MGRTPANYDDDPAIREQAIKDANTDAAAVAAIAVGATWPKQLDAYQKYSVVVPAGAHVHVLDLEKHLPRPHRPAGTYRPATVAAFIAHVNRHRDEAHTTIWVHPTSGQIIALLNDHAGDSGKTGWRDHRSHLTLQHTPEWLYWASNDGKLLTQLTFAEHIEDGVSEIVEPPAADLLELAQTFQAHQTASFRSATRLHDGTVQMRYEEEIDASAGATGDMAVPTEFKLSIAPFLGEDPWNITARLRYRLREGKLQLGYRLDRPHEIVRQTLADIANRLTDEFGDVFLGEPPAV